MIETIKRSLKIASNLTKTYQFIGGDESMKALIVIFIAAVAISTAAQQEYNIQYLLYQGVEYYIIDNNNDNDNTVKVTDMAGPFGPLFYENDTLKVIYYSLPSIVYSGKTVLSSPVIKPSGHTEGIYKDTVMSIPLPDDTSSTRDYDNHLWGQGDEKKHQNTAIKTGEKSAVGDQAILNGDTINLKNKYNIYTWKGNEVIGFAGEWIPLIRTARTPTQNSHEESYKGWKARVGSGVMSVDTQSVTMLKAGISGQAGKFIFGLEGSIGLLEESKTSKKEPLQGQIEVGWREDIWSIALKGWANTNNLADPDGKARYGTGGYFLLAPSKIPIKIAIDVDIGLTNGLIAGGKITLGTKDFPIIQEKWIIGGKIRLLVVRTSSQFQGVVIPRSREQIWTIGGTLGYKTNSIAFKFIPNIGISDQGSGHFDFWLGIKGTAGELNGFSAGLKNRNFVLPRNFPTSWWEIEIEVPL